MASGQKDHLRLVGLEGFALIDENYGPTRRPSQRAQQVHQIRHRHRQQYQYQQSCIYHDSQINTVREPVINQSSRPTRQFYGSHSIYQEPQVSAATEEAEISSNEAAQVYGGMVMLSYTRTRPLL